MPIQCQHFRLEKLAETIFRRELESIIACRQTECSPANCRLLFARTERGFVSASDFLTHHIVQINGDFGGIHQFKCDLLN